MNDILLKVKAEEENESKDSKYLRWVEDGAKIFSTCAKRQYMAMIVDKHGYVVGVGYNGAPSGFQHCKAGGCPRYINGTKPGESYDDCISNHAEQNAIMNAFTRDAMRGGTIYVNGPPCWGCAKLLCNTGLSKLVYLTDPNYVYEKWNDCVEILERAGIELVMFSPEETDRARR